MSRRAFTIGITNDDQAVILKDHTASLREHKAGLRDDDIKGEFKEVFILETSRANKSKTFRTGGGVNHGASILVADQTKKSLAAVNAGMKGSARGNSEGKINPAAALTVAEQQGRKPAKKRSRKKKSSAKKTSVSASPKVETPSGGDPTL